MQIMKAKGQVREKVLAVKIRNIIKMDTIIIKMRRMCIWTQRKLSKLIMIAE